MRLSIFHKTKEYQIGQIKDIFFVQEISPEETVGHLCERLKHTIDDTLEIRKINE